MWSIGFVEWRREVEPDLSPAHPDCTVAANFESRRVVTDRPEMSRRAFLTGSASLAALIALDACSSGSSSRVGTLPPIAVHAGSTTTTTTVPRIAGQRPDPAKARGHRSDPRDRAHRRRHAGEPLVRQLLRHARPRRRVHARRERQAHRTATPTRRARRCARSTWRTRARATRSARTGTRCTSSGTTARWTASCAARRARRRWGYWDGTDIPFYYGLAKTFPVCDRWFASCFGQTLPNRRFLMCGSALGTIATLAARGRRAQAEERHDRRRAQPVRHLVARLLHDAPDAVPVPVGRRRPTATSFPKIEQFFTDAAAGNAAVGVLGRAQQRDRDRREPAGHLARRGVRREGRQRGDAQPELAEDGARALLRRARRLLRPRSAAAGDVAPDDIKPILKVHPGEHLDGLPANLPGDYTRYGFRVPGFVVSPYARKDYVSHVVHDHTSILSLIEHKWNLPALTNRDGAADNLLDSLDLVGPPAFLAPPKLPAPKNTTGAPICTIGARSDPESERLTGRAMPIGHLGLNVPDLEVARVLRPADAGARVRAVPLRRRPVRVPAGGRQARHVPVRLPGARRRRLLPRPAGLQHLAFIVRTRSAVDRCTTWCASSARPCSTSPGTSPSTRSRTTRRSGSTPTASCSRPSATTTAPDQGAPDQRVH